MKSLKPRLTAFALLIFITLTALASASDTALKLEFLLQEDELNFMRGELSVNTYRSKLTAYLKQPGHQFFKTRVQKRLDWLPTFTSLFLKRGKLKSQKQFLEFIQKLIQTQNNRLSKFSGKPASADTASEIQSIHFYSAALLHPLMSHRWLSPAAAPEAQYHYFLASESWLSGFAFEEMTAFLDTRPDSKFAPKVYELWHPIAARHLSIELRETPEPVRGLAFEQDDLLAKYNIYQSRYGETHDTQEEPKKVPADSL